MSLTEVKIKTTKPSKKATKLFDGGGLYLYVSPAGGKLWRWAYRVKGKEKTMSFGPYPEVSLADARNLHFDARKLLRSGVDPMEQRKAGKLAESSGDTFKAVALRWHETWSVGKNGSERSFGLSRFQFQMISSAGVRSDCLGRWAPYCARAATA